MSGARDCRRRFLRLFPAGFRDGAYLEWERNYKAEAHARWMEALAPGTFRALLKAGGHAEIAARAIRIESASNLLEPHESLALAEALAPPEGSVVFADALYDFLYGRGSDHTRLSNWCAAIAGLPQGHARVLTWPIVTVFGFIARPDHHLFLKPAVIRRAAEAYGVAFDYRPPPEWPAYLSLLDFAAAVKRDIRDLKPRDMIDIQSFIRVQGSDDYDQ